MLCAACWRSYIFAPQYNLRHKVKHAYTPIPCGEFEIGEKDLFV